MPLLVGPVLMLTAIHAGIYMASFIRRTWLQAQKDLLEVNRVKGEKNFIVVEHVQANVFERLERSSVLNVGFEAEGIISNYPSRFINVSNGRVRFDAGVQTEVCRCCCDRKYDEDVTQKDAGSFNTVLHESRYSGVDPARSEIEPSRVADAHLDVNCSHLDVQVMSSELLERRIVTSLAKAISPEALDTTSTNSSSPISLLEIPAAPSGDVIHRKMSNITLCNSDAEVCLLSDMTDCAGAPKDMNLDADIEGDVFYDCQDASELLP